MVSSVQPYSYFDTLAAAATPVSPVQATTPDAADDSADSAESPAYTLSPLVAQLLDGLLPGNNDDSLITQLLGGSPEKSVLASVYSSSLKSAFAGAAQKAAQLTTQTDPLNSVLSAYQAYQSNKNTPANIPLDITT